MLRWSLGAFTLLIYTCLALPSAQAATMFHYTFDAGDATDLVDGSVDGALVGAAAATGDVPGDIDGRVNTGALDCSGIGGVRIDTQNFVLHGNGAPGDATLECFIKGGAGGHQALFWTNDGPDVNRYNIYWNGDGMGFGADYAPASNERDDNSCGGGGTLASGTWTHLALVRRNVGTQAGGPNDGNTVWEWTWFQDHVQVGGPFTSSESLPDSSVWHIGFRGGCCNFEGIIDEVRGSDAALDPSEFLQIQSPSNFNEWYIDFEEGSGTDTLNALDGTRIGGHVSDGSPLPAYSSDTPGPIGGRANNFSLDMSTGNNGVEINAAGFPFHQESGGGASGDATLEWYIKPGTGGHQAMFWTGNQGDNNRYNIHWNGPGGNVGADYASPTNERDENSAGGVGDGVYVPDAWHHIAMIRIDTGTTASGGPNDGNKIWDWQWYHNAGQVGGGTSTETLPDGSVWNIGFRGGCCNFEGLMDEIKASGSALDPSEMLPNLVDPAADCPRPTLHITFEEGSGTDIIDQTDGSDIGDLMGGAYDGDAPSGNFGGANNFSYDMQASGWGLVPPNTEKFSLHNQQGDATLEWFAKVATGNSHSSFFWTEGGAPVGGNMNIFWGAEFAGNPEMVGGDLTGPHPIVGNGDWTQGDNIFPRDTWFHVAIVRTDVDGGAGQAFEWRWYLDGTFLPGHGVSTTTNPPPGEQNGWQLCGRGMGAQFPSGVKVDEIRMFDAALTPDQLLSAAPVTMHISFEEGSGTDLIDQTDGSDIGDLMGANGVYDTDAPQIRDCCPNEYSYNMGGDSYGLVSPTVEPFILHNQQGDATLEWFAKVAPGNNHSSFFWTEGGAPVGGNMNIFWGAEFAGKPETVAGDLTGPHPIVGGGDYANSDSVFPRDEWFHVAVVRNDTDGAGGQAFEWRWYLNGEFLPGHGVTTTTNSPPGEQNGWQLCGRGMGAQFPAGVKVDEIRMASAALSTDAFLHKAPDVEPVDPNFCFRFEGGFDGEFGTPATVIGGASISSDVPNILGIANAGSLDASGGGDGLVIADADKTFIFHSNSAANQSDATLQFFVKYPAGMGHSSPFFTHADAGGGLPDNNRYNMFINSCFGGGGDASICANHFTFDDQIHGFLVDHSAIASLIPDAWNHIAVVRTHLGGDDYNWNTFYNHEQVGGAVMTTNPGPQNPDYWAIGLRGFTGLMDEIKGTARALAPGEFMQFAPEDGEAWYRFEDMGGVVNELTGLTDGGYENGAGLTMDVPAATIYDGLNGHAPIANTAAVDLHGGGSVRIGRTFFGFESPTSGDVTIEFFNKVDPGFGHGSFIWSRGDDADSDRFNCYFGAAFDGNANGYGLDYNSAAAPNSTALGTGAEQPAGVWTHNAIVRVDEGGTYGLNWYVNGVLSPVSTTGNNPQLPTPSPWQFNGRGCCKLPIIIDEYRQTFANLTPDQFLTMNPPVVCVNVGDDLGGAIGGALDNGTVELEQGVHSGGRIHVNKTLTIQPKSGGAGGAATGSAVIVEWPSTQDWEATIQPGVAALYEGNGTNITVNNIHFRIDVSGTSPSSGGGFQIVKVSGVNANVTFNDCIFEYTGTAPADVNVFNRNMMRHEGGNTATYNRCEIRWSNEPVAFPSFVNNIGYFVPGETLTININDTIFDNVTDTNGRMRSIGSGGGGGGRVNVNVNNCIFQEDEHGGLTRQQAWISTATATTHIQVNFCDFQSGADRFIGHEGNPNVTTTLNGCVLFPGGEAILPDPGANGNIVSENTVFLDAGNRIRSAIFCCENENRSYVFRHCTFQDNDDQLVFSAPNAAPATEFSNCLFNMPNSAVIMNVFGGLGAAPVGTNNMSNGGGGASTTAGGDGNGEATPDLTIVSDLGLEADGYHLTICSPAINAGADIGITSDVDGDGRQTGAMNIDFEEGSGGDVISNGKVIGSFQGMPNGYTTDTPDGSGFAFDFAGGGFANIDGSAQTFPFHEPSGDAELSWDAKVPAGQTHASFFWTEIGGGPRFNIFWGAEFAGARESVGADGPGGPQPISNFGPHDGENLYPEDTWFNVRITRTDTDGGAGSAAQWDWYRDGVHLPSQTVNADDANAFPNGHQTQNWHLCGRGNGPGVPAIVDNVQGSYQITDPPDVGADEQPAGPGAGLPVITVPGDHATIQAAIAAAGPCTEVIEVAAGDYNGDDGVFLVNKSLTIRGVGGAPGGGAGVGSVVNVIWGSGTDWESTVQPGVAALYENATSVVENIRFVIDVSGTNPSSAGGFQIAKIAGPPGGNVTFNNCVFEYTGSAPADLNVFNRNMMRHEGANTTTYNNCHIAWTNDPVAFPSFVNNIGYFVPGEGVNQINLNGCTLDNVSDTNGRMRSIGSGGGGGGMVEVNATDCLFAEDSHGGLTHQQAWVSTATPTTTINLTRCTLESGADRFIGHEGNPNVRTNLDGCIFLAGGEAFLPDPGAQNNITSTNCVFYDAGARFRSATFCCENESRAYTFRHCTFIDETPNGPVFTAANFTDASEFTNCLFNMPGQDPVVAVFGPAAPAPVGSNNMSNGGGGADEAAPGLTVEADLRLDLDGYHLTDCSPALGAGTDIGTASDVDGEARPQPDATNPDIGADENALDAIAGPPSCDFEAPSITCSGDVSVQGNCVAGELAVNFDPPVVSDNVSDPGNITVVCSPASGSNFPAGDTVVTCTATDEAGNESSCMFTVTVTCGGTQRPGDINQDGVNDSTDQINLLENLFLGMHPQPCDTAEANEILLDANGDGQLDQSDALWNLIWFFLSGSSHVLGEDCVPIVDCPDNSDDCN